MKHISLLALILPLMVQLPATAWDADDIAEIMRDMEIKAPPIKRLSEKKTKAIALCSLDVKSKREKYARTLDMFLEGVGADKDVDTAKVEYEKAQVNLASQWNKSQEVLKILRKQDILAQQWMAERVAKNKELAKAAEREDHATVKALSPENDTHPKHDENSKPSTVQPKRNSTNRESENSSTGQPKDINAGVPREGL